MPAACTRWRTPTRPPQHRSWRCWHGCPPARPCRCLCSTVATTPPSSPLTSPTRPPRCWCGCALTAASTPTRHQRRAHQGAAGHAATGPSSPAPTRLPGQPRPQPLAARTTSTARSPSPAGQGCIPNNNATPATAPVGPVRSCAAPSSVSRSSGSPPARGRPRCCGCGGQAPARSTWTRPGGPMSAGSTWK
jgi:hypothetical protein